MSLNREKFLRLSAALLPTIGGSFLPHGLLASSSQQARETDHVVTEIKVHVVKVNQRGNWLFIELKTSRGIVGVGEASHGVVGTSAEGQRGIEQEIAGFFELVKGQPIYGIEQYRQRGWNMARSGRTARTAFSAIEQALWDIQGQTLGVPVHQLRGGKIRDKVKVYANINRATNEKDSNGRRPATAFQKNAEAALAQGFKAIKMAPFDEMKPLPSTREQIKGDVDHAMQCLELVRKTIGSDIDLLVDVHSHLDEALGIEVAKRVEPLNLFWFEEPVNPEKYVRETKAISDSTTKATAGGESIFGREGFSALIQAKALDILMPDVKHCGGIQELRYIAAMAETAGLSVAPHNPSGPIATAASINTVAGIPNFEILELAHGEVPWRADLVTPAEEFKDGYVAIHNLPGLGVKLNHQELSKHV